MKDKEMTLRDKILLLDLKPRNAPPGIKVDTFGKWLRAVKNGEEVGPIATSFLTLLCDGRLNGESGLIAASAGISSQKESINTKSVNTKNMKKNPHIEERVIYEGSVPKGDGFIELLRKSASNPREGGPNYTFDAPPPEDINFKVDKSPKVVKPQVDDVPIATMGANNYDASQDMKFRIVGGIRKLVYNGKWWLVAADAERFSVMGRVFSASEFEGL